MNRIAYVAPFWTTFFWAYADYGPSTQDLTYQQITQMVNQSVLQAMQSDAFTTTAQAWQMAASPPDTDGDGVPDINDNCPAVANADQLNSDGEIDNGSGIAPRDTTVPAGDARGDACETDGDLDNDRLLDGEDTEPLTGAGLCGGLTTSDGHTHPGGGDITDVDGDGPSWDTDGDAVRDGAECALGFDPRSAASKPGAATCGGAADLDLDGLSVSAEKCKWGTSDTLADSDGDGIKDCVEANDTNGDGVANFPADVLNSAKAANSIIQKTLDFDLNGDGVVTFPGDTILSAKMVSHVGGIC